MASRRRKRKKKNKNSRDKSSYEKKYDDYYKLILIIPVVLFLLAAGAITYKYVNDGEFINRGLTFAGGISVTLQENVNISAVELRDQLREEYPDFEVNYRLLGSVGAGGQNIVIESNIQPDNPISDELVNRIVEITAANEDNVSVERIGAEFGDSFFRQMFTAIFIAFVFMGTVVFFYFRTFLPSMAVILAAIFNIVVTVAIVNTLGLQMGTAGVAGLLMLIGYSIDTDILLTTRMLKEKRGDVNKRILDAMTTGLTMTVSTGIALLVAYLFVSSEVLREVALVVMIGLLVDIISTYVQNASVLKWYLEATGTTR